ncbi:hypothetical protein ABIA33_003583 [Streptacidiphilus sp. MAP12-16]|uniref:hypothetical protein n=1 Tax=Streptacidiphilus sp. MAP12-16 TaxID=3156300 RepID=UPI0035156616
MTALHPRALAAAGVLSLGALLLSGCSSATAKTSAAQPSSSSSGGAQFSAYRQCLSQHGVTLPTGRPSGRPTDRPSGGAGGGGGYGGGFGGFGGFGGAGASADPATQAAMKACASLRPSGGRGGGNFNSTALAAFTSCMKDHGVTLPANGGLRALNTADPKTAAAYTICKALLPTRGTRSPGASASPSA